MLPSRLVRVRAVAGRSLRSSSLLSSARRGLVRTPAASITSSSKKDFFGFGAKPAVENKATQPDMFCFQCEQTDKGSGCTTVGVCGKKPSTAGLQNCLEFLSKGAALYLSAAKAVRPSMFAADGAASPQQLAGINQWLLNSLFSTMTNVNFDDDRMVQYIDEGVRARAYAQQLLKSACKQAGVTEAAALKQHRLDTNPFATAALPAASLSDSSNASLIAALTAWSAENASIVRRQQRDGADIVGLQEMTLYGLKGTAAYADHTVALGGLKDETILADMWTVLAAIAAEKPSVDSLLTAAMKTGEINVRVMAELAAANRTYGVPTPTTVNCSPVPGKCLLVSGHDMKDMEEILKQTEGKGINVYTHGEMLPAHSYPKLKAYKHLVGHYGGPWQLQKFEFGAFPGAIVMTSNCIVEPLKSYKARIFTRGVVGFHGVRHIDDHNFAPAVKAALDCPGFTDDADDNKLASRKDVVVGFAHETILSVADKVIAAVKAGHIKRFFYIGGCDGSEGERSYFSELAASTGKDTVILTAGCGKFRVNRLPIADENIGGIPRVLDLGQCNDSYSGVLVADALRQAFGLKHLNDLPLTFAVSWFEQKAVAILLSLLHMGVKNIHLGPNLPGFATPAMLNILVEKFNIQKTDHKNVKGDLANMMNGK